MADSSYILSGFTISQAAIGLPTTTVSLTGATLINANNTGDASWWTAPASPTTLTLPTGVGGLQSGRNYVELELYAEDGTPLQRAFWDPSANSGEGTEFIQAVDTVTEMFVQVVINQSSFTGGNPNRIQLAIIDLDGSLNIRGIKDKRNMFFRLGKPDDIDNDYTWSSRVESPTTLVFTSPAGTPFVAEETITFASGATAKVVSGGTNNIQVFDFSNNNSVPGDLVTGGTSGATATLQSYYEAFTGSDKEIKDFRSLITALQNEIRVVKGTRFWYEVGGAASLPTLLDYVNVIPVPLSEGARYSWDGSALTITDDITSGQTTADELAALRIPGSTSQLALTRQDGTGGSATLTIPDGNLLFVKLPDSGNRSYSEAGTGVSNYQVVALADFVPTDKSFILAYREGSKLIVVGIGELEAGESVEIGDSVSKETLAFIGAASDTDTTPPYTYVPSADLSNQFDTSDSLTQSTSINAANINDIAAKILRPYQEQLVVVSGSPADDNEVQGPLAINDTFTLPLDSRDSDVQRSYKVGSGGLIIFLNGVHLTVDEDYEEVGSFGSLSYTVRLLDPLVVDDQLDIRIINPQYLGNAAFDQPYFVNYIIGQNGTAVPVGAIYNVGTDRLQVWRNGIALNNSLSAGDAIDRYQEANNNSLALALAANADDVFAMVNHELPNSSTSFITGVTGTVLTVPTYTMGDGSLRVFRNGVLLTTLTGAPSDQKYSETSTTSITLALAATVSDVFKVYKSGTAPVWRERATGLTGTTLTIPSAQTYTMGNQKLLVFRNGLLMANSTVIGDAVQRYQEASTTTITLYTAAASGDVFEWIYV